MGRIEEHGSPIHRERSLDLAAAMQAGGHDVEVLVGRAPRGHEDHAAAAATARGLTLADVPGTLVFYESPKRVAATLADAAAILGGGRQANTKDRKLKRERRRVSCHWRVK